MKAKINWYSAALHVMLVVLAGLVIYLAKENKELIEQCGNAPAKVAVGEKIDSISVTDLHGKAAVIVFSNTDKPTVLVVFSTSCGNCLAAISRWNALYREFGNSCNFVGISKDSVQMLQKFTLEKEMRFQVYHVEKKVLRDYKLVTFPGTTLLKQGVVRNTFIGKFDDESAESLAEELRKK